MSNLSKWMSWEAGVSLSALTSPELQTPNIIICLANMVHTPEGSAPAGMILWQPDPSNVAEVIGFVSADKKVASYFGPSIFIGTLFEKAPVLNANISVYMDNTKAISRCEINGYLFELEMSEFSDPYLINRPPTAMPPFWQQGIEIICSKTVLRINGNTVNMILPPVGVTGGPASVLSPTGVYVR